MFIAAARHDRLGLADAIRNGASVNDRLKNGMTPLHAAIDPAGRMRVSLGLASEAGPLATPALIAPDAGSNAEDAVGVVRQLIGAGADTEARDLGGSTPLHAAARPGGLAILKELIARGAQVRAEDSNGFTPLHLVAMLSNDAEAATALVDAGADVNAVDRLGFRPIDYTGIWENWTEVPRALISAGAKTSTLDRSWRRKIAKSFMPEPNPPHRA